MIEKRLFVEKILSNGATALFLPSQLLMNYIVKILLALLGTALLSVSCVKDSFNEGDINDGKILVELIQTANIKSRTSIEADGYTATWSPNDQIALWAEDSSNNFALDASTFTLTRFNESFSSAIFAAYIDPMATGEYTYYATYPVPTSTNGLKATYAVSNVQDGSQFNGAYDIMVATPTVGNALDGKSPANMNLKFSHKMHALKFVVPRGNNLLELPITRIDFTFPTEVVGDVTIDAADPTAAPVLTNGSRQLSLTFPNGINEGEDMWAMVFPTNISGEITYTVYSGEQRAMAQSIYIDKVVEESHISPISIVVPEMWRVTTITFSVAANYLGEDISTISIVDSNGSTIKTFTTNPANKYDFEIVGTFNDTYSGKSFRAVFDSPHATVEQSFTMPTIAAYAPNSISLTVPYLLYEDFSSIGNISSNDNYSSGVNSGSKDAVSFLNGWTGARMGASAGKAIRIASRRETSANYPARVDSRPLTGFKGGAKLAVQFSYSMNRQEGGLAISMPGVGLTYHFGYVTANNAYSSGDSTGTFPYSKYLNSTNGDYDTINNVATYTLEGCPASTTRLSWRNVNESKSGTTNGTYWLYIDNVIVQIAQ